MTNPKINRNEKVVFENLGVNLLWIYLKQSKVIR